MLFAQSDSRVSYTVLDSLLDLLEDSLARDHAAEQQWAPMVPPVPIVAVEPS